MQGRKYFKKNYNKSEKGLILLRSDKYLPFWKYLLFSTGIIVKIELIFFEPQGT